MKDVSPQMRVQAIRASESLTKAGDKTIESDVRERVKDGDASVVIQALLTLNLQKVPDIAKLVEGAQAATKARGVKELGDLMLRPPQSTGCGGGFRLLSAETKAVMEKGQGIYAELCYSCHGQDGNGEPLAGAPAGTTMAPPLAGSPRVLAHKDYVIKTVLHGLTGPVDGATYSNVMIPMNASDDEWIASIASFVRNTFGNQASFVSPADVARVRAKTKDRADFWTVDELESSVPSLIVPHAGWKATASHNVGNALRAVGGITPAAGGRPAGGSWSTGARQQAGMWLTIDMAAPATVSEIHFDSPAAFAGQGGPGGPRPPGAGGPGAAPAGAPALLRPERRPRPDAPAAARDRPGPGPAGGGSRRWRAARVRGRRSSGRRLDASARLRGPRVARRPVLGPARWRPARARQAARRSCSSSRCGPATSASRRPVPRTHRRGASRACRSTARRRRRRPSRAPPSPSRTTTWRPTGWATVPCGLPWSRCSASRMVSCPLPTVRFRWS